MKQILTSAVLGAALSVMATAGTAACYADYKAKQDDPLRLHYGVVELAGACTRRDAQTEIAPRLARGGWTLLNVISVFGADGLPDRRDNAGSYYLRF